MKETVRIGCGAGFWGDSPEGPKQLVRRGGIDYLVLDYLAEITMSILARMKAKNPDLGYATDFVGAVMKPLAREIAEKRIRVVTNAGGVNPEACGRALEAVFRDAGVDLKVAVVKGDDLSDRLDRFREADVREMFSGAPLPERMASVNAYLGAFPIAAALDAGADVVVTGRCVDSAVTLGPLIHEFGWTPTDFDRLSAGSLAGHVLECGAQVTGGIFTDWRSVADGWDDMGFPIAECGADGGFVVTKPEGTGGIVSTATVAEQIVYEVGDPAAYVLPDVACDWSGVHLEQVGPDRVRVSGARGRAPTPSYKVSATYADGYRATVTMMIAGREAAAKAEAVGRAILARCRRLMAEAGFADFAETSIEVLGAESSYGAASRARRTREVILKIGVRHHSRDALQIFAREIYPAATAMAQGLTGFAGGRPEPQPVIRLFSFLADKADIPVSVSASTGEEMPVARLPAQRRTRRAARPPLAAERAAVPDTGPRAHVPLIALAHGRSGDKGDIANIGVLARRPEFVAALRSALTPQAVRAYFAHYAKGEVERFDWPGLSGMNFMLHQGLGGGGIASLRHDPQGKALAQILMDFPVAVPAAWLAPAARRLDRNPRRRRRADGQTAMNRHIDTDVESGSRTIPQGPDRQSRRDRLPRHAHAARTGHRFRCDPPPCRDQGAPCPHGRRGGRDHRRHAGRRPSRHRPDRRRGEGLRRRRDPSRLRLPVGERALRRKPWPTRASPSSVPMPKPSALMGDKISARTFAEAHGVPVAPSVMPSGDLAEFTAAAERIGFPLLIKAAAGGGGKGMSIVRSAAELAEAARIASSEAQRYFGDGRVYAELYVERPRHIEVQVLGDGKGGAIHLFERECSVQRRFQKIIEEAPAANLPAGLRDEICASAVRLAAAARYKNAGTVEFILGADGRFFFLEMNTRLQVEHPVTEMITGVDLVRAQIEIAAGNGLPLAQADVRVRGHSIECRICAEDPERGFLPETGTLRYLGVPEAPHLRFENALDTGQKVTADFDPMLAKLVVHGGDREPRRSSAASRRWANWRCSASPPISTTSPACSTTMPSAPATCTPASSPSTPRTSPPANPPPRRSTRC